jgi:hypothetical protein
MYTKTLSKCFLKIGSEVVKFIILGFRKRLVGLWCLMPLSTIFQLIYLGGQNEVTWHSNRSKNK